MTTWDDLELPVLRALAGLEDQGGADISQEQLSGATGLPPQRVALALRRLVRAGFVAGHEYRDGTGGPPRFLDLELLERGLRAAGAWPED